MQQIPFTAMVLGPTATYRLKSHQVTQTIRSRHMGLVIALLAGNLKRGDQVKIILDGRAVGMAEYTFTDKVNFKALDQNDAKRGGFDSLADLGQALKRAGYRFKGLEEYTLYRCQFTWLEMTGVKRG